VEARERTWPLPPTSGGPRRRGAVGFPRAPAPPLPARTLRGRVLGLRLERRNALPALPLGVAGLDGGPERRGHCLQLLLRPRRGAGGGAAPPAQGAPLHAVAVAPAPARGGAAGSPRSPDGRTSPSTASVRSSSSRTRPRGSARSAGRARATATVALGSGALASWPGAWRPAAGRTWACSRPRCSSPASIPDAARADRRGPAPRRSHVRRRAGAERVLSLGGACCRLACALNLWRVGRWSASARCCCSAWRWSRSPASSGGGARSLDAKARSRTYLAYSAAVVFAVAAGLV
jgi:hypothetical protein